MTDSAIQFSDLESLELMRAYKARFVRNPEFNESPFATDRVVRYGTTIEQFDVPEIHHKVRTLIEGILASIHGGSPSQIVILTGEHGMGKSHLLNWFRNAEHARQGEYIFVCNSNHWRAEEFDECLLDWILDALTDPDPTEPHLLLEKIKDIAFRALEQIIAEPGELNHFTQSSNAFSRLWTRMTGSFRASIVRQVEERDLAVFKRIDYFRFAGTVCKRFLVTPSHPFHRYVMHVLLRYLFSEDREKVIHWLRRKQVGSHFLNSIGIDETIDRNFKIVEVIKILMSLFSPDVSSKLKTPGQSTADDRVFFLAFDQSEAREALFRDDKDWFSFFAQLSELYNALPNVFIMFTMSVSLRNKYSNRMERQFKDRIRQDADFVLHEIEGTEILSLYRTRISHWLRDEPLLREQLEMVSNRYLPMSQNQVLELAHKKTLREFIDALNEEFHRLMNENISVDVPIDYLVLRNELRSLEEKQTAYQYLDGHLYLVEKLFQLWDQSLCLNVSVHGS